MSVGFVFEATPTPQCCVLPPGAEDLLPYCSSDEIRGHGVSLSLGKGTDFLLPLSDFPENKAPREQERVEDVTFAVGSLPGFLKTVQLSC